MLQLAKMEAIRKNMPQIMDQWLLARVVASTPTVAAMVMAAAGASELAVEDFSEMAGLVTMEPKVEPLTQVVVQED